ncbi:hypothetical protein Tco_0401098 [Tanacetum coccineum]|uniref:Uncharacterized protein n=1 Tax=Tanacetum coccineum TaxID=301880 RepID=A0ABQ4X1V7_9ASTR
MLSIHPSLEIQRNQGTCRRSPSKFSGKIVQDDRYPNMFTSSIVRARQGFIGKFEPLSVVLFIPKCIEFVDLFGTGATTGATMGSRTGVVIGSGPTGGWTGAVLCEQEGCTWSFVTSGIGPFSYLRKYGIGGSVPDPTPEVEAGHWQLQTYGPNYHCQIVLLVTLLSEDTVA